MSVGFYWVGQSVVHQDENRVALPEAVVESGVAAVDGRLFWAYSEEEDAVVVSRSPERFTADGRFELLGDSPVRESRTTNIPREVVDSVPEFDRGTQLHFVTSDELEADSICMVLPQKSA